MIEAHIFRMVDNVPEFLLLKRSELEVYPGIWQMVTGSSNQDERALQTVVREIKEETDLMPKRLWVVPFINSFYSWKRNHICLVPVFAAMVENDAQVRISEEHTEYKWVTKDEAVELLAWIGQRSSVNYIYDFFTTKNSHLNFEEINMSRVRNSVSSK